MDRDKVFSEQLYHVEGKISTQLWPPNAGLGESNCSSLPTFPLLPKQSSDKHVNDFNPQPLNTHTRAFSPPLVICEGLVC